MIDLRIWRVILAEAAAEVLAIDDEGFRPAPYPYPTGNLQTPSAVVFSGNDRDWIRKEDAQSFCSNLAWYSIALLAGREDAEPSWPMLDLMVSRIYGMPALVKDDERAVPAGLAGKVQIQSVSAPTPFVNPFDKRQDRRVLSAFVEVAVPLHKLTG